MSQESLTITKENYYGVNPEILDQEPKEFVEGVIRELQQAGSKLSLNFIAQQISEWEWQYGDFNHVFFMDNGLPFRSFHRFGDKTYKSWFAGDGNPDQISKAILALGLDENAVVIVQPIRPRNGWEAETHLNGPVLGAR